MPKVIRVLIVDDSALIRKLLTEILEQDPGIEVVGTANDPYIAREKIKALNPDVITLDIEMPKMDGITFLSHLMRLRPMPVIMISTLTEAGADLTLKALELGAVDFVSKPKVNVTESLNRYSEEITAKVKSASGARVRKLNRDPASQTVVGSAASKSGVLDGGSSAKHLPSNGALIAIGASTGGTEAVKEILMAMPADAPPIVIAQHIPAAYVDALSKRWDRSSAMNVSEAWDGQKILPGHAYLAPGDKHLKIVRSGAFFFCKLDDGPPVNRHKPAVDVLFESITTGPGANAIGVLLTGMGDDGARGLKQMRESGAYTIAQDEKSSVVWGMPGAAVKMDAVDRVVPLKDIPQVTIDKVLQMGSGK